MEESHARELHQALKERFAESGSKVLTSFRGGGVNWHCYVKYGTRECRIACFDVDGPEYLTTFQHTGKDLAHGRTASMADTINATIAWIHGANVIDLHRSFDFVDRRMRRLADIRDHVVARHPEFDAPRDTELKPRISDLYELHFRREGRSSQIAFYGKNTTPDAAFYWDDGRELFRFRAEDLDDLADVLKAWIRDPTPPSRMRELFPWLEIAELADYYERGEAIKGEFLASWNFIEKFFDDDGCAWRDEMLALIAVLRAEGFDEQLRAGQSMWSLIVSRSKHHGLDQGQPYVAFWFDDQGARLAARIGETVEDFHLESNYWTPRVEALFRRLADQPID